jgi:4-amino-4-deoxy-L-arabinose transferase-like glycosyltransferase
VPAFSSADLSALWQREYRPILYFTFLLLIGLAWNGGALWDQDEAAYAGFAKRMLDSGNWLIPDFIWSEPHRKPPLHFWHIALSFKLFGVNTFALRLPSALFLWASYLLVYGWVRRALHAQTALLTVMVLSTTLLLSVLGKVSVTDSTLLFFETACAVALWHVLYRPGSRRWVWIFWGALAMALLVKGPPVLLFTGVLLPLLWFHPQRQNLWALKPWWYGPLALLPFAAWAYLTVQQDGGALLQWLLDWYVVKRIGGSVFGQSGPPGTHVLYLALSFLPWILFLPGAIKMGWQALKQRQHPLFFAAAWAVAGWLLWEFSPSKLPVYTMAAQVPLALFVAQAAEGHRRLRLVTALACGLQVLLWGLILPLSEPMRNVMKQVSEEVRKNAEPGTTVYLAHQRFRPPSLPYYLEQAGMKPVAQRDLQQLVQRAYEQEAAAFLLSDTQAELLKPLLPDTNLHTVSAPLWALALSNRYHIWSKPENPQAAADSSLPPVRPLPFSHYLRQALQDTARLQSLYTRAGERGMTALHFLYREAAWLQETDFLKADYVRHARAYPLHRAAVERRAKAQGVTWDEQVRREAEQVVEGRWVR